jgi:uncharacterized membrane protein (DUF106 family)
MSHLLFAVFELIFKIFSHLGEFIAHIHWEEIGSLPRILVQIIRHAYNDSEAFWTVIGWLLVILLTWYVVSLVRNERKK